MPSDQFKDPFAALRAAGVPEEKIEAAVAIGREAFGDPLPSAPQPDPYAPTAWAEPVEFDFHCPSGQLCRMRRLDPVDLVSSGLMDGFDILTGMVTGKHIANANKSPAEKAREIKAAAEKAQGMDPNEGFSTLMSDPENSKRFKNMIDEMVVTAVVKPIIYPIPNEGFPRQDGVVYVDSVAFNDKMAIFNRALGQVKKLEPFRGEASEPVGDVASVSIIELPTE